MAAALEYLSDHVQSGQLIGIAFAGILRERHFTTGWAGEAGQNPIFTLGALDHLHHDLVKHTQDESN